MRWWVMRWDLRSVHSLLFSFFLLFFCSKLINIYRLKMRSSPINNLIVFLYYIIITYHYYFYCGLMKVRVDEWWGHLFSSHSVIIFLCFCSEFCSILYMTSNEVITNTLSLFFLFIIIIPLLLKCLNTHNVLRTWKQPQSISPLFIDKTEGWITMVFKRIYWYEVVILFISKARFILEKVSPSNVEMKKVIFNEAQPDWWMQTRIFSFQCFISLFTCQ
jgi:hypothetical protein